MSGTPARLIDFLADRVSCPVCGALRVEKNLRQQMFEGRPTFVCGAVFVARGEIIVRENSCRSESDRAAELWTIEAGGPSRPAGPAHQDEASAAALPASQDEGDGP